MIIKVSWPMVWRQPANEQRTMLVCSTLTRTTGGLYNYVPVEKIESLGWSGNPAPWTGVARSPA